MAILTKLIELIDVIIWPITLLVILGWFRPELKAFFKNLKKIQASSDGVVFESFELQMSKTRELFPTSIDSKSQSPIDDVAQRFLRNKEVSPQVQLQVWHDILSNAILSKVQGRFSDPVEALKSLKSSGQILISEYDRQLQLLKLTGMHSPSITEESVRELQRYLNDIKL